VISASRPPQAVPVDRVQVAGAVTDEETLVSRLDDVFGLDLVPQPAADVAQGKGDELVGEAAGEFPGRAAVARPKLAQEVGEGIRHRRRPSLTRPGQARAIFFCRPGRRRRFLP
jgi:hypothetical protein